MSKDAQNAVFLNDEARKKFDECGAGLTLMRYGPEGPPKDTTFAEIEAFGHRVGRMLAQAVDEELTSQHGEQFGAEAACPTCEATSGT